MFISKNLFFYIKRYQEMGCKFLYQNFMKFRVKFGGLFRHYEISNKVRITAKFMRILKLCENS